jgi:hypothetical protein
MKLPRRRRIAIDSARTPKVYEEFTGCGFDRITSSIKASVNQALSFFLWFIIRLVGFDVNEFAASKPLN